jgi:glyoxylase-like metal-dependent hydrolase (beta-lactamase superfamily II)
MCGLGWLAITLVAQTPSGARPSALTIVPVAPQVKMIAGAGGNIVVQTGTDGVIVVDSGNGERSEDVLAAIANMSNRPIRYLLNTSAHADHVGGNDKLSAAGDGLVGGGGGGTVGNLARNPAARLGHENVLLRMSAPFGERAPFAEALWPTEGYIDKKSLYLNGEPIQLIHQPAAHSDADSLVFFRRSDVIVAGEIIDTRRFPVIDVAHGGSIIGEIAALNTLVDLAVQPVPLPWQKGGTQVVPGHGRVMDQADVVEYRDMVTIVRDVVQDMIRQGKTIEQVGAANPTLGYNPRYGAESGPWTTRMFVDAVYTSLSKERRP